MSLFFFPLSFSSLEEQSIHFISCTSPEYFVPRGRYNLRFTRLPLLPPSFECGPAMRQPARWLTPSLVAVLVLVTAGTADAERARFHFAPTGPGEALQLVPAGDSTAGEGAGSFGKARGSVCEPPQPTCRVTFKHLCTGQEVTVPLALPEGTPIIEHVRQRIVYNYGSYTVEVRFLPDGGVDVVYNSGLLRRIDFPPTHPAPIVDGAPPPSPSPLPMPRTLK